MAQPSCSYHFDSGFLDPSSPMDVYLVVLNYQLPRETVRLWRKAKFRICADGGANRLYDELPAMMPFLEPGAARASHLPDLIKGDLDSVRPDVRQFYSGHGVPVVDLSADQDTTDLTKCIMYIEKMLDLREQQNQQQQQQKKKKNQQQQQQNQLEHQQQHQHPSSGRGSASTSCAGTEASCRAAAPAAAQQQEQQGSGTASPAVAAAAGQPGPRPASSQAQAQPLPQLQHDYAILALGALGGRLDHTLGNINTLHMFPHLNLLLLGDGNLVRLLPSGCSTIRPQRDREGPTCGLVPLMGRAVASSSGLRWNLQQLEMQFSGLVSTSNIIDGEEVWVQTDVPLLWTTELNSC